MKTVKDVSSPKTGTLEPSILISVFALSAIEGWNSHLVLDKVFSSVDCENEEEENPIVTSENTIKMRVKCPKPNSCSARTFR